MIRSGAILFVILMASPAMAAQPTAKVTLRASTQVPSAKMVTISDIAAVQGSKALAAKISAITVGNGPLPGERRTIDASYVRLKVNAAEKGAEVKIVGPNKIEIVGNCVKLSASQLSEEARIFVLSRLPQDGKTYDAIVSRPARDIVAAAGSDVQIRPRLLSGDIRPGVNNVIIDVLIDGNPAATTSATLDIKAVAEAMVAIGTIKQGEAITGQNTTWDKRDVTKMPDAVTQRDSSGNQGWVARRMIRTGTVITLVDVETPPVVKAGDTVALVVKCGNIVLQTAGEAKQNGKIGDTVRVLSSVSDGEVRGTVTESGVVEIRR